MQSYAQAGRNMHCLLDFNALRTDMDQGTLPA